MEPDHLSFGTEFENSHPVDNLSPMLIPNSDAISKRTETDSTDQTKLPGFASIDSKLNSYKQ